MKEKILRKTHKLVKSSKQLKKMRERNYVNVPLFYGFHIMHYWNLVVFFFLMHLSVAKMVLQIFFFHTHCHCFFLIFFTHFWVGSHGFSKSVNEIHFWVAPCAVGLCGGDCRPCGHLEREKKKKNRFAEANREREKEGDRFCKEEDWGVLSFTCKVCGIN